MPIGRSESEIIISSHKAPTRGLQVNGKKRYIPIVALGALLLTLLAILPVAAAGEVSFVDPGDIHNDNDGALTDTDPDEQEWSRQGGQVGVFVDDSDLNFAVRRVLIPGIDTVDAGDAEIKRNSNVIKFAYDDVEDLDATDGVQSLVRNDLVMVGLATLRKVTKVEWVDENDTATPDDATDDTFVVTLDRAYGPGSGVFGTSEDVLMIKRTYVTGAMADNTEYNAFDGEGYKSLASGLEFRSASVSINYRAAPFNDTQFELDRDIADSGIGSHIDFVGAGGTARFTAEFITRTDKGLRTRLMSAPGRGVRNDDVLMLQVTDPTGTPNIDGETYPASGLTAGGTFTIGGNRSTGNHLNTYVLFWASEENDTGSSVTVRSQAYQTAVPIALGETTPNSGKFAAKVHLIAAEARVSWDDIPTGDTGDVVKLTNTSGDNGAYLDYKVEIPAATRPATVDADTPLQKVEFVADFDRAIPRLPVNVRDTISVRHPDDTATIRVETTASVFSAFSPAHNSSTRDSRPELSAQVIDGDSGLDDSKVDIIYTVDDDAVETLHPDDIGYVDEVSGGFAVRARVTSVGTTQDRVVKWWVKAVDEAGNVTYSDRQRTVDGENDFCTVTTDDDNAATASDSKCQPYIITVDNTDPNMLRAETGRFWDTSLSTGDSDDKTEYRASEASRTSVMVVFNEHLDIGSVQANDFEVNDATPQSADVFNVTVRDDNIQTYAESGGSVPTGSASTDDDPSTGDGNKAIAGDSVQDEGEKRGYVFLTVGEMTTNAKPKVELVNNIEDVAGNRRSTGSISEATDRIGPTLTVSFREGDRPVTNKDVTLTVTSDEDIGSPDVRYYRVKSTSEEDEDSVQLLDTARTDAVVNFRNAKEYEVKITPPTDGLYTVFIEADDSAGGNPGTIGDESVPIDVVGDTTAVLLERDKAIAKPDFDPSRDGVNDSYETDDPNGFIRIDYSAEASEYYDAGDNPMICNQQVETPNCTDSDPETDGNQPGDQTAVTADDLDTYGRLTIISATLDGSDISGDLNANSAGNIFQYHLDGMAVGEYKLEITVRDEAGNQNAAAHKGTVKIIERKPYKLTLNPGWNLVSLPGQPADTDINAVIPADHPVDAVATYDPMAPGSWLTSLESGDGTFDGTVETIEAGLAYWIRTTSFQTLDVDIPKPTPGATTTLLPTIPISQGWNLVPVLDVDGDFELAEQTAEDNYFSGLTSGTIAAIYTYDTVTNSWANVAETGVKLGKGYWVYATKPGVIVP